MNKKLVLFLPFIAGIFWGSGGVFVRTLNSYGMNSITIFASRITLATLILFIGLFLFDKESLKIKLNDLWLFIGTGILGVMLLNLSYNEAAFTITLSLAAVLLGLAPIFAIIFSSILFNEKITSKKIICIILAILGCILVSGILENYGNGNLSYYGVFFGILSAVFWALYGIFSKKATQKGYSTFTTIFYSFLLISIFLIIPSDWSSFGNFLMLNPLNNGIFAVIHTLCTSILPYALFTLSLKYIENGEASILCSCAEPLTASTLGLIIYSESLGILKIIGIILTIIAISVLSKEDKPD